jgi:predicted DNA-binding antitoxin AbrB/MazE fold protein
MNLAIEARVDEAGVIRPKEPIALPPGSRLLITVPSIPSTGEGALSEEPGRKTGTALRKTRHGQPWPRDPGCDRPRARTAFRATHFPGAYPFSRLSRVTSNRSTPLRRRPVCANREWSTKPA